MLASITNKTGGINTMVDKVEDRDVNEEEENTGSGGALTTRKIILLAALLSIVLGAVMAGATLYFVGGDDATTQAAADNNGDDDEESDVAQQDKNIDPEAPPLYFAMDPRFIVSFSDQRKARYMQFSLQVMTRDEEVIAMLKKHMPAVRSSLLLMAGSQQSDKVITREGKEEMLAAITADINTTLENVAGVSGVEASYFDYFVVQ
jgi:flagellar FliL protein